MNNYPLIYIKNVALFHNPKTKQCYITV